MIAALALCAHLVAAHAVTGCRAGERPDSAVAIFDSAGGRGLVMTFDDATWRQEGFASPIGSPAQKSSVAQFGAGYSVAVGPHVVVAVNGTMPAQASAWVRLLKDESSAIRGREQSKAAIAEERSNPSGVVDLAALHSHGEALQFANAQIAAIEANYRKLTGLAIPAMP
jgi:hypothetical protein